MPSNNGKTSERGPLELREVLHVETKDGEELEFEVVAVLEDPDDDTSYAVLLHEGNGGEDEEFIVTDMQGNLLDDADLAQDVLDEFLLFAEEAADEAQTPGGGD